MHHLMRVDGARNLWQTNVAVHTHEGLMLLPLVALLALHFS